MAIGRDGTNDFIYLAFCFFNSLFNFCRLDAAIDDQIFKRNACNGTAHRVI